MTTKNLHALRNHFAAAAAWREYRQYNLWPHNPDLTFFHNGVHWPRLFFIYPYSQPGPNPSGHRNLGEHRA